MSIVKRVARRGEVIFERVFDPGGTTSRADFLEELQRDFSARFPDVSLDSSDVTETWEPLAAEVRRVAFQG